MPGNTFGQLFRVTTFGESHGGSVGVIIDGCPPGLAIRTDDVQKELDRRRPGQSKISSPRNEQDEINIASGVFEGVTTGTPIMMFAKNKDQRSQDYDKMRDLYRPGHADFTFEKKYGFRDYRGGGRSSARETLARVAAGAIAQKFLYEKLGIEIVSFVESIKDIALNMSNISLDKISKKDVDSNIVRCPNEASAKDMIELIESVKNEGDSVGGVIRCVIRNVPVGLGEPVFDKLHSDLGKAMLSINAVKGFEIGDGFACTQKYGSENNDSFESGDDSEIVTSSNHAGGVLGGISNGMPITMRVAFKPVSTIKKPQTTIKTDGTQDLFVNEGRHDPCVLPRAVPIVDAMAAITIMDHYLRQLTNGQPGK